MDKKNVYDGKIKNKSVQMVEAAYKTSASKAPKVKSGGDLRSRKSGK